MIPYAELERAIARWKARQAGHEVPAHHEHEVTAEAVVHETYAHQAHTDVEHEVGGSGLISIEDEPTRH